MGKNKKNKNQKDNEIQVSIIFEILRKILEVN